MDYTLVVSNSGNSTFKETVAKFKITCVGQCDGVVGKCEIMWDNSFKGHEHVSAWLHCMINNPDLSSADFLGMLRNYEQELQKFIDSQQHKDFVKSEHERAEQERIEQERIDLEKPAYVGAEDYWKQIYAERDAHAALAGIEASELFPD
jgi:hypothetical protein